MDIKSFLSPFKQLFTRFILNNLISYLPFFFIRKLYMKLLGVKMGRRTIIDMGYYIFDSKRLIIGKNCHINRQCMLDARGGITIGNNVSISHCVKIVSGSHNYNSKHFDYETAEIFIGNNVWIGINAIILKGVQIGEGAVIAAGAIVTKDCEPYGVYAGIPAKKVGTRQQDLDYDCTGFAYFRNIRKPYFN